MTHFILSFDGNEDSHMCWDTPVGSLDLTYVDDHIERRIAFVTLQSWHDDLSFFSAATSRGVFR